MALIEARTPLALEAGETDVKPFGVFARPTGAQTGWKSWLTTVDHKRIGIMYGIGSMFFFFSLVWSVSRLMPSCGSPD